MKIILEPTSPFSWAIDNLSLSLVYYAAILL